MDVEMRYAGLLRTVVGDGLRGDDVALILVTRSVNRPSSPGADPLENLVSAYTLEHGDSLQSQIKGNTKWCLRKEGPDPLLP